MKIQRMKTNRIVNPLGFDLKTPHVSWTVTDTEAKKQLWARVEVSKTEDFANVIFDTGACKTASSLGVPVEIALEPRTRYFWRVTVMGDNGELVTSDTAWFETAKLDEPFTAQRISPCLAPDTAPYMRRAFEITGEVLSARAYFTGLGIYELYLNGEKANDEYLAPGCTAYDSWIQYQTYDVTDLIHTGENVIGAILGNGWAKGRFGFDGVVGDYETNFPGKPCNMYTEEYLLFGELHVTTTQGETVIVTDESWQCAPNPLTFGNIYDGERYDANLEIENWCAPSCTYANWQPVKRNTTTNLGAISARLSLPVKAKHIITPKQITTPKNELVFDLGQNITGWFTFMADLPAGVELRVQTGELLQDDCFYRDNLRTALSEYRYISTGKKAFIRPIATFYGFRYIKFSGVADLTGITDIQAWALYSDLEQTGEITTANEKVNRLYLNSVWSQRDNFLDVPTDCPQRDERMGWTGDIAVFAPTAAFNFDMNRFLDKWLLDVQAEQLPTGGLPNTVPVQGYGFPATMPKMAVAWWGDACVLVPWAQYMARGDVGVLRRMYPTMKKYVNACRFWCGFGFGKHRYLWEMPGILGFGDWVAPDVPQMSQWQGRIKWTGTASLCNTSALLAKIADILGETQDAKHYRALSEKTADAYCSILTDGNGKLLEEFQTAYVLPIYLNMFPTQQIREKAAANLAALAKRNDWCIGTGFPGTPYILFALCDNGQVDAAYHMLLNTKCPSWLYEVKAGATTIWERWDGLDENGVCPIGDDGTDKMISYNHYASGAVGDFLYRRIAGIEPTEAGYKTFRVKPILGGGLTSASAKVRTPYGDASVQWETAADTFTVTVCVPIGTRCELTLPDGTSQILASGTHTATCSIS